MLGSCWSFGVLIDWYIALSCPWSPGRCRVMCVPRLRMCSRLLIRSGSQTVHLTVSSHDYTPLYLQGAMLRDREERGAFDSTKKCCHSNNSCVRRPKSLLCGAPVCEWVQKRCQEVRMGGIYRKQGRSNMRCCFQQRRLKWELAFRGRKQSELPPFQYRSMTPS